MDKAFVIVPGGRYLRRDGKIVTRSGASEETGIRPDGKPGGLDLVARIDSEGRVIEVNPNLPAGDEARARVKVDAFYIDCPAPGSAPTIAATYKPGDWVVTAGGTEDKAQKLVELRAGNFYGLVALDEHQDYNPNTFDFDGTVDDMLYSVLAAERCGRILRLATDEEVKAGRVLPHLTLDGRMGGCTLINDPRPPIRTAAEWGRVVIEGRKLNKHDRSRLYVMVGKREERNVELIAQLCEVERERDANKASHEMAEEEILSLIRQRDQDQLALEKTASDLVDARSERDTLRTTLNSRWPWYAWLLTGAAAPIGFIIASLLWK